MSAKRKTPEEFVAEFADATAAMEQLAKDRKAAARRRSLAIVGLQGVGWSLKRIADTVGLSKNAIAKARMAGLTEDEQTVLLAGDGVPSSSP